MKTSTKGALVAALMAVFPVTAFPLDVRMECRSAWLGSPEHLDSMSKSASEQAIAKHDAIEKCVREMTAHMERGNTDPTQALQQTPSGSLAAPEDGISEPVADADPRLHDQSWIDEWEKRWLCDGLTLYKSGDFGKVVLDGIDEIPTHFTIQGLSPRWDWDGEDDRSWDNESVYRYAIVLGRGGSTGLLDVWTASFYDFKMADEDGFAEPSMTFIGCHD